MFGQTIRVFKTIIIINYTFISIFFNGIFLIYTLILFWGNSPKQYKNIFNFIRQKIFEVGLYVSIRNLFSICRVLVIMRQKGSNMYTPFELLMFTNWSTLSAFFKFDPIRRLFILLLYTIICFTYYIRKSVYFRIRLPIIIVSIEKKKFVLCIRFLQFILNIFFLTNSCLLFYIRFERLRLPICFIIIFFGYETERERAAKLLFFVTGLSSVLIGVSTFYIGRIGFDNLSRLKYALFSEDIQILLWISFFIGFASKIPIIPFHFWLPEAHVEASTEGSVILAGILLKIGRFGFLRICAVHFFRGHIFWASWILSLALFSSIASLCSVFYQIDIKKIVAYSSIAHINYALAGFLVGTKESIIGAFIQCFHHSYTAMGLFFRVGILVTQGNTREITYYTGLQARIPRFAVCFRILSFTNGGFPLTLGFIGESLILINFFKYHKNIFFGLLRRFIIFISLVSSVTMLTRLIFGVSRIPNEQLYCFSKNKSKTISILNYSFELNPYEKIILYSICRQIFYIGLNPSRIIWFMDLRLFNLNCSYDRFFVFNIIKLCILCYFYNIFNFFDWKIQNFFRKLLYLISIFRLFSRANTNSILLLIVILEIFSLSFYSIILTKTSYVNKQITLLYFIISIIGTLFFIIASFWIFIAYGSFIYENIELMSILLSNQNQSNTLIQNRWIRFILAFFIKFSRAPLHRWIPEIYDYRPFIAVIFLLLFPKMFFFRIVFQWKIVYLIDTFQIFLLQPIYYVSIFNILRVYIAYNRIRLKSFFFIISLSTFGYRLIIFRFSQSTQIILWIFISYIRYVFQSRNVFFTISAKVNQVSVISLYALKYIPASHLTKIGIEVIRLTFFAPTFLFFFKIRILQRLTLQVNITSFFYICILIILRGGIINIIIYARIMSILWVASTQRRSNKSLVFFKKNVFFLYSAILFN